MTELQQKLLEYYKTYHKEKKTHPSLSMVAEYFGITRQTLTQRAESLAIKGYLEKVYDGAFIPTSKR